MTRRKYWSISSFILIYACRVRTAGHAHETPLDGGIIKNSSLSQNGSFKK